MLTDRYWSVAWKLGTAVLSNTRLNSQFGNSLRKIKAFIKALEIL